MPNVPRMRLCSSFSVVAHLFCRLVCFFQRGVGFSQAMSLSTPCEKFQFLVVISKPRVLANVWVSVWVSGSGVRAYGCVGVWVSFFCSCLFASACLGVPACLPALGPCLPWVPARLGCLPACPPALGAPTVSTTRGTVPFTLVTAQHERIPSQPYGHFLVWKAPRQAQGRVAPIGLEFCGRSLRHRQVHIRSAWAALGLHLK